MWGDPFCMTAAWTLPTVANARILTYTFSSSNYSCTMCSFHHEVTAKYHGLKLYASYVWFETVEGWQRKSVAVDQDSARSYYIIPWLAFSTVFIINVRIWWVEFYCCIQDSSQPEFCRASGTIFSELCINNLFNGYSVLFEAVESSEWQSSCRLLQFQIRIRFCFLCAVVPSGKFTVYTLQCSHKWYIDVLYSGYFQFVFKALTLKVDGSLSWLPCVLLQFLWFWTLSVPFHIDELVWSC